MITMMTNIPSMQAQNNLNINQAALNTSMERLSSGLRINSAADDAAGLAIAQGMNQDTTSMNQDVRNVNDAVSLTQTADSSLSQIGNLLTQMTSLATQAATGTVAQSQRSYINSEYGHFASEITRIASATVFNGLHMLNGTTTQIHVQVGTTSAAYNGITISTKAMDAGSLGVTGGIDTSTGAAAMQATLDTALSIVNSQRANLGSVQNRFTVVAGNLQSAIENSTAAQSQIMDVDVAQESAQMTSANILVQAGTAILSQANQTPQLALKLLGG